MPRLDLPARHDAELCIKGLDIRDAEEQQAIRAYCAAERLQERKKRERRRLYVLGVVFFALISWLLLGK